MFKSEARQGKLGKNATNYMYENHAYAAEQNVTDCLFLAAIATFVRVDGRSCSSPPGRGHANQASEPG
jgi:hypothetical protein